MPRFPLIKADLSRWASTSAIFGIGKWLPLLIAPVALLVAYGKVQAAQKKIAERRVEQLTNDVRLLSQSLAQAELFIAAAQDRADDHAARKQVLANEDSDILDLRAPDAIVDILRSGEKTRGR